MPQDPAECIKNMCDAIEHRGPDSYGYWSDKELGIHLGHRRLSIIDLSVAGNQPMQTQDGRLVIVFNGEIYNHSEIRKQLERTSKMNWRGALTQRRCSAPSTRSDWNGH